MNYNFNEKEKEMGLPVWQSPKYLESKKKAIEMIEKEEYGLSEADFWILMNKTKDKDKMIYTGLIISHNGCLKINDKLEHGVKPQCFSVDKEGYANSLVYTYIDEDTYEVGEFNSTNGKNDYPYAMAFKRCFDRVVLKKSKLAYSGIYSEVEADEFRETIEEKKITQEDADNFTFKNGKHTGKTIKQVYKEDPKYIDWLINNTKDERMLEIIRLATGLAIPTIEEQKEICDLMTTISQMVTDGKLDYDEIYDAYEIKSIKELGIKELKEIVEGKWKA